MKKVDKIEKDTFVIETKPVMGYEYFGVNERVYPELNFILEYRTIATRVNSLSKTRKVKVCQLEK